MIGGPSRKSPLTQNEDDMHVPYLGKTLVCISLDRDSLPIAWYAERFAGVLTKLNSEANFVRLVPTITVAGRSDLFQLTSYTLLSPTLAPCNTILFIP